VQYQASGVDVALPACRVISSAAIWADPVSAIRQPTIFGSKHPSPDTDAGTPRTVVGNQVMSQLQTWLGRKARWMVLPRVTSGPTRPAVNLASPDGYALEHQDEIAGLICEDFAYQVAAPPGALAILKESATWRRTRTCSRSRTRSSPATRRSWRR
jgi:hypothetical protein